ncbi:MAG: hypothetical protein K0S92_311 [Desertimonas sp.]|nr:hypothetical protein [Desertimonas sp.]
MTDTARGTAAAPAPGVWFAGAALAGALVAVALGVYGQVHDAASETTIRSVFSTTLHFKAWMTTAALVLATIQVLGALWMFGKLPGGPAPLWVGPAHRITGSLALLLSLPVAYHCLWSLGFNPDPGGSRRFWHSVLGCAFYGAFATKILVVRSRRMPGWALPIVGGLLFTVLVLIWLTSSWWFFRTIGVER